MDAKVTDACPSAEILSAFSSGRLADDDLARVADHLERCAGCLASLKNPDPFTQSLQRIHQDGVSPWTSVALGGSPVEAGPYFFCVSQEPPTKDADQFFDTLAQSRLFDADDMKAVRREWKAFRTSDLNAFAQTLALEGRLTDFHVRQLLRGKWRGWALNDYVVLHPLSAGGMQWVFQAFHRRHKRTFALKVTPPHLGRSTSAVKLFHREIKTIAKLKHPRLVAAVDAGEAEDLDYLVMEEMPGHSLAEWVELNGPMRILSAVDMIREAAEGIAAAHEAGVIHRDLRPSNLWIETFTGSSRSSSSVPGVKVLDFGMAQMNVGEVSRSSTGRGAVVGTSGYMAPEQARDSRRADERSDLYSLGCCLSFLLSGKDPPADTAAPALESSRETAPESLQMIYRRMTAALPDDRYASADEMIQDLDAFMAGSKISAHRPRWLKSLALGAATLLIIAGIWFAFRSRGSQSANPEGIVGLQGPRPASLDGAIAPAHVAMVQKQWAAALGMPVEIKNSLGMTLRLVPPGTMTLGTPAGEIEERLRQLVPGSETWQWLRKHGSLELPRHDVTHTQPFYMGTAEVTVGQFRAFVEASKHQTTAESDGGGVSYAKNLFRRQSPSLTWRSPGYDQADDASPVVQVSYADAEAFCRWLSVREGRVYTLPTEAQWEFACRAGCGARWFWGNHADGVREHVATGPRYGPQAVAQKRPNALGLYDMSGNVAEWCSDWYDADFVPAEKAQDPRGAERGTAHVVRGGAFLHPVPDGIASASRLEPPDLCQDFVGFRVIVGIKVK